MDCIRFPTPLPAGLLTGPANDLTLQLGAFELQWRCLTAQLLVIHGASGQVCAATPPQTAFLSLTVADVSVTESRGFFELKGGAGRVTEGQEIEAIKAVDGRIDCTGYLGIERVPFCLSFTALDDVQLTFRVQLDEANTVDNHSRTTLSLVYAADASAFGCGEQFTHVDLRGQRVPIISQEPGIGRGIQPLSWVVDKAFRAAGSTVHSNAPAPHLFTSDNRSLCLTQTTVSVLDLRVPGSLGLTALGSGLDGRIFYGESPKAHISAYTRFCGRMRQPPMWCDNGAIIGMQGGAEAQDQMDLALQTHDTPISAYWLQDWVGARKTAVGSQLWWNWEADESTYPEWTTRVAAFRERGIRTLVYINPFLVDTAGARRPRRDLYAEAVERGYVVLSESGEPYPIKNTDFDAALVDLTNPTARQWLKEVIKTELLGTGVSGWMADFGEALPFDASLYDDADPFVEHNRYPERWAALNAEAVKEANAETETLFFMRSGFSCSPQDVRLFWTGDQLTSWSARDGIRSALRALLSSGFSGFSLNHSDIGGYTTTDILPGRLRLPGISYRRGRELLWRWIEMNAFTAFFRTHEGNKPSANHQIDSDPETTAHFARFARIYTALSPYRRTLFREAEESGIPVVRHSHIVHPTDDQTRALDDQFFLGDDLLVAPVFRAGNDKVEVYVPDAHWRDFWTNVPLSQAGWMTLDAPLGRPPVLMREGNVVLTAARQALADSKDLVG